MFIPDDVIKYIFDFCDIETLYSCCVNREFNRYITKKDWRKIWLKICEKKATALSEFAKKTTYTNINEYKNVVRLAGFTGCMVCKKKNIRKVWWEFKIRCCAECLYSKTIGEWKFNEILPSHTYINLPFTTKDMYNKHYGCYTINFYWKKTIDQLLLLHVPVLVPIIEPTLDVILTSSIISASVIQSPPKQKKEKKQLSDSEIESRNLRKNQIDNLCINHDIVLEEALQYSEIYNSSIKICSKLQTKHFIENKLPIIQKEIQDKKEQIEQERQRTIELAQLRRCPIKKLTCEQCINTTRLFTYDGLLQHKHSKHKN